MIKIVLLLLVPAASFANTDTARFSLQDAEKQALVTSRQLKASQFDYEAAHEQARAQFTPLLPRLSFQASYQYFGTIPQVSLLGTGPAIPFGTNSIYSIGPTLNYTVWDTFSGYKNYQSSSRLALARSEDLKSSEIQVLFSVRTAYIQVQLALEELRLTQESLALARAQDKDVTVRYQAGSAAKLDLVTAHRNVLGYEIQLEQKQSSLSSALRDLFAQTGNQQELDISRTGPPLPLLLDPMQKLLNEFGAVSPGEYLDERAGENHPQIKSIQLQGEAAELSASAQSAKLFPTLQLTASIARQRLNMPNPPDITQETFAVLLSVPLYLGDPSPHLAAQQRAQAQAAFQRKDQLRINMERDDLKARELLSSLKEQQNLAVRDIAHSEEAARLYYTAYRAGKLNLIDVQNADLQALQARVRRARVDAQILVQLMTLRALSGKELPRE